VTTVMSAAASRLRLESSTTEQHNASREQADVEKWESGAPTVISSEPSTEISVIAIDLDDVLSQTNQIVAEWHNSTYGTNMDLSSFYYYYYWKVGKLG